MNDTITRRLPSTLGSPATAKTWTCRWQPSYGRSGTMHRSTATWSGASYVDEAKSGRIADRPEFRKMIDETAKPNAPFQEILTPRLSDAPEMELSAHNDLRALVDQRDDR